MGYPDQTTAHRAALDHMLALIAAAPWGGQVVLRGSMLLTAYLGDAAREPQDLDFVVLADGEPLEGVEWEPGYDWREVAPYGDLVARLGENKLAARGVELEPEEASLSDEFGYEGYGSYEMSGARLEIPWHVTKDGEWRAPHGATQMDFALDEKAMEASTWTRIPRLDGGDTLVRAASPQLSLVWKLLWLMQDTWIAGESNGKDLYDAVLLAELPGMTLDGELLREIEEWEGLRPIDFTRELDDLEIDWEQFKRQCPQADGTLKDWIRRLENALKIV